MTYDSHGNTIGVADPLGNKTTFTYDAVGLRLVSKTDPRGHTTSFDYDANRNLLSMTQADGTKVKFTTNATPSPLSRTVAATPP